MSNFKERLTELLSSEKLIQILKNPAANPRETVLIVAIFTVLFLILAVIITLIIFWTIEEEEEKHPKKELPRWVKLTLLFIVLSLVLGGLIWGSIKTSDSLFCSSCHPMREKHSSWRKSIHKVAPCVDCHRGEGITNYILEKTDLIRYLYKTYTSYQEPIFAQVENSACVSCHREIMDKTVTRYGIRVDHESLMKGGFKCVDCHSTVAHEKNSLRKNFPAMSKCIICHDGVKLSSDCKTCHLEDYGKTPRKATYFPRVRLPEITRCDGCHPIESCNACHGVVMPHPSGWMGPTFTHAKESAFEKKRVCWKCHPEGFCANCHRFPGHDPNVWKEEHKMPIEVEPGCLSCHDRTYPKKEYFCRFCHEKYR